jgi:signal transduction histidine kinase
VTSVILERVEHLVADAVGDGEDGAVLAAGERARALHRAGGASPEAGERAAFAFAGETLGVLVLESGFGDAAQALVELLRTETQRPATAVTLDLYRELLRSRFLGELPPALATEGILRAAVSLGPLEEASLWQADPGRGLVCLSLVGGDRATRRVRACARELLLDGRSRDNERGHVHAVPVFRWGGTYAGLVLRARPADREVALAYAGEAASELTAVLERERLLRRGAAHERALVESSERRLVRIGLDIHDGPLQVLATLVGDTRILRDRLTVDLGGDANRRLLLAWLDDYALRLREVDEELRELALSLESQRLRHADFAVALRHEVSAFAARSGIEVDIDIGGSFTDLTASQRFAIAAVVREALANVREHGRASHARLRVRATTASIRATVADDGRGFDVERALVVAASRGRLGLVGMSERVRLLGGKLAVDSRPGGPTAITVTLPRWAPATAAARGKAHAAAVSR